MTARSNRSSILRKAGLIASVAMVAIASACSSDNPVAPDLTARNGKIGDLLGGVGGVVDLLIPVKALERDVALQSSVTRSFTISREKGGKLEIDEAGLRIDVPARAISTNSLTITVTVLPGKSIAYDFQPHGTKFLKPLAFRQDLGGTSWDHFGFNGTLNGGYFKSTDQLNLHNGLALLDELFPIEVKTHEARFNINHFSGYMVSGGRQGSAYYEDSSEF